MACFLVPATEAVVTTIHGCCSYGGMGNPDCSCKPDIQKIKSDTDVWYRCSTTGKIERTRADDIIDHNTCGSHLYRAMV